MLLSVVVVGAGIVAFVSVVVYFLIKKPVSTILVKKIPLETWAISGSIISPKKKNQRF